MPTPEELPRDELIVLVGAQAGQISRQAAQIDELLAVNEDLAARLAALEHLLSRNSGNSWMPSSKDGDLGRAPPEPRRRWVGSARPKGQADGRAGQQPGLVR